MFSNILVPLDGSELGDKALPIAQELARLSSATIHLLQFLSVDQIHLKPFLMRTFVIVMQHPSLLLAKRVAYNLSIEPRGFASPWAQGPYA